MVEGLLPFPWAADRKAGYVHCFGRSRFILWVILAPSQKSIPDSTKYGSVCLLVVRSKVPRWLNYLKRERRWSSSLQPDLSTLSL